MLRSSTLNKHIFLDQNISSWDWLGSRYINNYLRIASCSARPMMVWGESNARFSIRIGYKWVRRISTMPKSLQVKDNLKWVLMISILRGVVGVPLRIHNFPGLSMRQYKHPFIGSHKHYLRTYIRFVDIGEIVGYYSLREF